MTVKENAVEPLERRKNGALDGKLIYMSTVTDPYQPVERQVELARGVLEVLADRHIPKLVVQTPTWFATATCSARSRSAAGGCRST